jgi:hypothetical protein
MDHAECPMFPGRTVFILLVFDGQQLRKQHQHKFRKPYQKHHFLGQKPSHRVSDQDYIGVRVFVCRQPAAQVIRRQVECFVRLVSWVDLRVDRMSGRKSLLELHVYMKRERVERGFTSHKPVYVDQKKPPFLALAVIGV